MNEPNALPAESLEQILAAGILAPSAENKHQMWFSSSGTRIVVQTTAAYRAASAQVRLLAAIAYGAVVENMLITASVCGWQGATTWFPDEETACVIDLSPAVGESDALAQLIPMRRTNRHFFAGPALSAAEQESLASEVAKIPGRQADLARRGRGPARCPATDAACRARTFPCAEPASRIAFGHPI